MASTRPKIAIRCDAGPSIGVGHLMRCIALAEELVSRDADVVFVGELRSPTWAVEQLGLLGAQVVTAPPDAHSCVRWLLDHRVDGLVIDSYTVERDLSRQAGASGLTVLVVSDGDVRGQDADVVVDQNLGAEYDGAYKDLPGTCLLGLDYVLLRQAIRRLRPPAPRTGEPRGSRPRVLAFFGGTDAADAAPTGAQLLLETAAAIDVTVVAPSPVTADALRRLPVLPDQNVLIIEPTSRIAELAVDADLVVSASGTSTWELMCLGVPTALVRVADNQLIGYRATTEAGLASGLGEIRELDTNAEARRAAVSALTGLVDSRLLRRQLSRSGWQRVDGRGRERVADVLLARVAQRTPSR